MEIFLVFIGVAVCLYAVTLYSWSLLWHELEAKVVQVDIVNKSVPGSIFFRMKYIAVIYRFSLHGKKVLGGRQGLFLRGYGPAVFVGDVVTVIKSPVGGFYCLKRRKFDFFIMVLMVSIGLATIYTFGKW